MRPTGSVFIATSLDGFIARLDGGIDWLDQANRTAPAGEDFGYDTFMQSVDALVMGRHTFELACTFPCWPYGKTPVHVLSTSLRSVPDAAPGTVALSSDSPPALMSRLARAGARRVYIDGGVTIQSFLRHGLIDDLCITRIPVLLGTGRPLFGPMSEDVVLAHDGTQAFSCGFVQSRYRVVR